MQHDYEISSSDAISGLQFRADLNAALSAIKSSNSGATAPTTYIAGTLWLDTSTTPHILKKRNTANTGWDTIRVEDALGTAIASATTTTVGTYSGGNTIHITGVTTITSLGVSTTGTTRSLIFDSSLTITHNATSLILPDGVNISTKSGSIVNFVCEDGALGYWRCTGVLSSPVSKAYTIATISDFANIPSEYTTAIVKDLDRGGTFIWSATGTANGGTVFAGATGYWNRQYSGAVNVKWFGAKGDGTNDDTIAVNNFIAYVGNGHGVFSKGRYNVTTVSFSYAGGQFTFENASIIGVATTTTDSIVEITTNDIMINGTMSINGNYNTNYTSAVKWHSLSAGTPSQFCRIDHLKINNTLIGLLYGQISGTAVIDAAQSENFIGIYQTRGVETAIYYNQSNGYLSIGGGAFGTSKAEWDITAPAVFNYNNGRVVKQYQGSLHLVRAECLSAENTLSKGFEILGGSLSVVGGIWEIAGINIELSGTGTKAAFSDVGSAYFTGGATLPFCKLLSGSTGTLTIDTFRLEKTNATADTAVLDVSNVTGWDVKIDNFRANNQQRTSFIKSTHTNNTWLSKIKLSNIEIRGSSENVDINNNAGNLVESLVTVAAAYAGIFYQNNTVSTVATSIDTVNVPTETGKTFAYSVKLDCSATVTSSANVITMDRTSATTIKNTSIRVQSGQWYYVEGWVYRATAGVGTVTFTIVTYDITGVNGAGITIANQTNWVAEGWTKISGLIKIGTNAAYAGIGISALNDIGAFADLKMVRVG